MRTAIAIACALLSYLSSPVALGDGPCRKATRCVNGEERRNGECCRKKNDSPPGAASATARRVLVSGFDESRMRANPIGEFTTKCELSARKDKLKARVSVRPEESGGAFGGCCIRNPTALKFEGRKKVTVRLALSREERKVDVKVEQSDNSRQGFVHSGPLASGAHELEREELTLTEVRQFCVTILGAGEPEHETTLTVDLVKVDKLIPAGNQK